MRAKSLSLSLGFVLVSACGGASTPPDRANDVVEAGVAETGSLPEEDAFEPPDPDAATDAPEVDSTDPTKIGDGLAGTITGVTTDKGLADPTTKLRALIELPIRDEAGLEAKIAAIYQPGSATFRAYLSSEALVAAHAPTVADLEKVKGWLESNGLTVARTTSNRLFLEITGTVAQFNAAFDTTLHLFERENPQEGNPPIDVLGVDGSLTVPKFVAQRIAAVVTADLAADDLPLPAEAGTVSSTPPSPIDYALSPARIATAYGLDVLAAHGHTGKGVKLGVVVGATFKKMDLQSFWSSFGVARALPVQVNAMEPPATRYPESTLDASWSGALAPDAELTVYQGPDSRNTSMIYTFAQAIADARVSVLTDSFAHREDSEAPVVARAYDHAAKWAAALGITVVAASGDGGAPDVPSVSPYVTAVGGSTLTFSAGVPNDSVWFRSGSGDSARFARPSWQDGLPPAKRGVSDVAVNAGAAYWVYYLGEWKRYLGTSFASPIFAAGVAVMNGERASRGLPPIGWLNPILYRTTAVQKAFRDVVSGATSSHAAGPGWDYPTGWGAPRFDAVTSAMP